MQKLHYTFPHIKDEATQPNVAAREDVRTLVRSLVDRLGGL